MGSVTLGQRRLSDVASDETVRSDRSNRVMAHLGRRSTITEQQRDDVRLIFKHAPIDILHEHARAAALGGVCADAAGQLLTG